MATFVDATSVSLSNNDFDVLFKAFQDRNFCKHFEKFAKEISNPKNLDHYESELKKLEKERGVDVTLLQPSPGIALQAELTDKGVVVFVNISVSSKIEKPDFSCVSVKFKWSVPHAVLKPRLEFDLGKFYTKWAATNKNLHPNAEYLQIRAKKDGIWIYELVVNPLCIDLAKQNEALKYHLIQIATENIRKILNIDLKSETLSFLGFDAYIGNPDVSQIKSIENLALYEKSQDICDSLKFDKFSHQNSESKNSNQSDTNTLHTEKYKVKIATYKLKHVNHVTLQDYSIIKNDYPESLRPQTLLLEVKLKGVVSTSDIDVCVSGKELHLKTQKDIKYNLDLTLPYEVEEEPKSAKFDISTGVLEIELKVIKHIHSVLSILNDSGIECENGYRTTSDEDNSSISSHEEGDLNIEESVKQNVVDNCTQHCMPKWQCFQSNNFLFMSVTSENIISKSVKLIILSLKSFKFTYKSMYDDSSHVPLSYEGVISFTPNSFKEKGVTYHILDKTLTIQVEKSIPGTWNKVEVRTQKKKSNVEDLESQDYQNDGLYSYNIDLVHSEMEYEYQNSDLVSSYTDNEKFNSKDIKMDIPSRQNIEAFFKKPLLPHCTFTQSYNFLILNIVCKNVSIKNVLIESIDQKTLRFQYKCYGDGFTPMFYGGYVNTAPYAFKNNGVSHHIVEDVLLIQVEKKKPCLWRKVRMGLEQKKMKEMKLTTLKNAKDQKEYNEESKVFVVGKDDDEPENCKTESGTDEDSQIQDEKVLPPGTNGDENVNKNKSAEIDIPTHIRNTNDCFVTGSWPRGILKSRSRSLSDSQVDSHLDFPLDPDGNALSVSLDYEDDALAEVTEDDVEMSEENDVVGGSSPKKSVRFNEFVCKQVFKVNSSILAQKAKNMKKAQQRKRSRERKLSEGSQSSDAETVTEQSDIGTTTEDEFNTDAEGVAKESKKGKRSSNTTRTKMNKKKKEKCSKKTKKNKRPVLSLSNEMVFQLDDD